MKWPDILHAPEERRTRATLSHFFGRRQDGLLPSTGPLWRSAHCTEAATQYLSQKLAGVYAITFEEQPDNPEDLEEHKARHRLLFRKSIEKFRKIGGLFHKK